MIGSLDKAMVFLHNPKCAGCSMTEHLLTRCNFVPIYSGDESDPTGYGVINKHAYVVPRDYDHCMVITGYRDPWSRWKSHFNYLYNTGLYSGTFDEFCRNEDYQLGLPQQLQYLNRADYIIHYKSYNSFLTAFGFPELDIKKNEMPKFEYTFNNLSIESKKDFIYYHKEDYRTMSHMGLIDKNFL